MESKVVVDTVKPKPTYSALTSKRMKFYVIFTMVAIIMPPIKAVVVVLLRATDSFLKKTARGLARASGLKNFQVLIVKMSQPKTRVPIFIRSNLAVPN